MENFCDTNKMKFHINKPTLTILVIISIVGAFGIGITVGDRIGKKATIQVTGEVLYGDINLEPLLMAVSVLNDKFVASTASSTIPTNENKVWGAIEGLAASYGDPYTVFFPPKESKSFADDVRGDFGGIGIEIGIKDKVLVVVAPLKGTPGERAGLKSGNSILKIDKKFTAGISVEDAVSLIRGPKGTSVTLTIKDNGDMRDVVIVRDTIIIPTIETKLRDDGVFVISLYNFSANSPGLFRRALREFILLESDKLVLDLRNNPGGYLEAAIDMASYFLPSGKVVVIEDWGSKSKQKIERSKGYDVLSDKLKMVVLINGGSASASEILAGALSEHGIAKLVGEKSYGKGSVQELVEITPETSLKVTIARWLTPKGHSISENGLEPDIEVKITKEDVKNEFDSQMEKAVSILIDPNFTR